VFILAFSYQHYFDSFIDQVKHLQLLLNWVGNCFHLVLISTHFTMQLDRYYYCEFESALLYLTVSIWVVLINTATYFTFRIIDHLHLHPWDYSNLDYRCLFVHAMIEFDYLDLSYSIPANLSSSTSTSEENPLDHMTLGYRILWILL